MTKKEMIEKMAVELSKEGAPVTEKHIKSAQGFSGGFITKNYDFLEEHKDSPKDRAFVKAIVFGLLENK